MRQLRSLPKTIATSVQAGDAAHAGKAWVGVLLFHTLYVAQKNGCTDGTVVTRIVFLGGDVINGCKRLECRPGLAN